MADCRVCEIYRDEGAVENLFRVAIRGKRLQAQRPPLQGTTAAKYVRSL